MNAACPSKAQLEDYASGRLDGLLHGSIDDHVDACVTCQAALETIDSVADASFACLRVPAGAAAVEAPEVRQLAARAKGLHQTSVQGNGSAAHDTGERTRDLAIGGRLTAYQAEEVSAGRSDALVLNNYVLLEPIGAGGMGRVFKAYHRRMKRVVALKLLAPDLLRSEAARQRFQREVEAVSRLSHANIVAAHDADEAAGQHFLVMEYVLGCNLAELVKRDGPLSPDRAVELVLQAACGLEHAHAAGIVHRDVKPANLLMTEQGTVKVLDLGLARLAVTEGEAGLRDLTTTGVVMGTAAFMAPEQALDTRLADHRADIYSLGCCLYYLLTGKPPFKGETPMAVLVAHREQPAPSLDSTGAGRPLEAIFHKMIAKRPEDRHGSMREVIAALEGLRASAAVVGPVSNRPAARKRPLRMLAVASVACAASIALAAVMLAPPWPKPSVVVPPPEPDPIDRPIAVVKPPTPAIDMVTVPAGSFLMGSAGDDRHARADEKPQHLVRITRPFLLGKTPVTQAEFEEVVGDNVSAFRKGGARGDRVAGMDTRQHPVESVTWEGAIAFCNALSVRHGLPPYYKVDNGRVSVRGGTGFRLPTEAEWEYACRAGTKTPWSFGDAPASIDAFAWHSGNSGGHTHPVGQKKANAFGLFDMHGNVPEWCWDRYDANYYADAPEEDPPGSGKGDVRVYRGGGWNTSAGQARSASRHTLGITYAVLTIVGLRVARNAP